jgi:hypothetical protein
MVVVLIMDIASLNGKSMACIKQAEPAMSIAAYKVRIVDRLFTPA